MKRNYIILLMLTLCTLMCQAQPTATLDSFIARGTTVALARFTYKLNGTLLTERGLCWSTEHNPTIDGDHSKDRFSHNGYIYKMSGLTPATKYYVRAYMIANDGNVYYSNEQKVYTLPMGDTKWSWDYGASDEVNTRMEKALTESVDYYLMCTSIKGFTISGHYDATDTPTASCSYGGYMRMGPGTQYQVTGTVMHEMAHGVGVGTISTWNNNATLRKETTKGQWLGTRANDVVKFFEGSQTAVLSGDSQHMWPYGNNYASEFADGEIDYLANAMVVQALGEDGLPPTSSYSICNPAYTFDCNDSVKYYLKSEDANRGLETDYMIENERGKLRRVTLSAAEAAANDSAAFYIEFNPNTCQYRVRNVATGHYFMHSGNTLKFADTDSLTSDNEICFLNSRNKVTIGSGDTKFTGQTYWLCYTISSGDKALAPQATGAVAASAFDFSDSASLLRMFILTGEQANAIDVALGKAEPLAIEDVNETPASPKAIAIYATNGSRINVLKSGVNIVKYSDGSVRKVFVK